jgi:hypothetical protein
MTQYLTVFSDDSESGFDDILRNKQKGLFPELIPLANSAETIFPFTIPIRLNSGALANCLLHPVVTTAASLMLRNKDLKPLWECKADERPS